MDFGQGQCFYPSGLSQHGRALQFRRGELLGAVTVDYRNIDYVARCDFYWGKSFYIMDREIVRHSAYEQALRQTRARYFAQGDYKDSLFFLT